MSQENSVQARFFANLNSWIRATLPALLLVGACATVFRSAVLDSIESTPHPQLIYLIFAAFFVGLVLSWYALHTYIREESILLRWRGQGPGTREAFVASLRKAPELLPIYNLLLGKSRLPWRMRQSAVDSELRDFEKRLNSRLALSGYVGGALVGLGLVGTFIGLLATLKELSTLFAALLGDQNANGLTQVEMFQDLIRRLQEPMRGMATAFVSSLYGLLGSLIIGLVIMAVRKSGAKLLHTVRDTIRDNEYGAGGELEVALQADADLAWAQSERWHAMFNDMRERHESLIGLIAGLREESHALLESATGLGSAMRERASLDAVIAGALGDGAKALARASEQYEAMLRCTEETRCDIQSMVRATHAINDTLKERNRIDAMVQSVFEQGPHWMNAWDNIGTETRRVRYLLEQLAEQAQERDDASQKGRQQALQTMLQIEAGLKSVLFESQQRGIQGNAEVRKVVQAIQACRMTIDELNAMLRLGIPLGFESYPAPGYGTTSSVVGESK
jgi:hypothetical protein